MFRIGILGCGTIAARMAEELKGVSEVTIAAVASRNKAKATKFAAAHCPDAEPLGSYRQLCKRDDIDLIYVSTPNSFHYEHALMCIKAYKNVLVEKPFMMSRAEADSIFTEAKNRNLFVCEAMWTAFMPLHKKMLEWINDGKIGAVKYISSNLGYDIENVPRLTDPNLGGGTYLDLGVYPTHLAVSILGDKLEPRMVYVRKYSSGIDRDCNYILELPGEGAMATSYVTMSALTDKNGGVVGDKGYIRLKNINNYEKIELYNDKDELVETVHREGLSGYALEVLACAEAIKNGRIQCSEMPWHKTAVIASLGDRIRSMM